MDFPSLFLLKIREQQTIAMSVHGGMIGDFVPIIVGVTNDHSLGTPQMLDVAVAVPDSEGNLPSVGLHRPFQGSEFVLTGKRRIVAVGLTVASNTQVPYCASLEMAPTTAKSTGSSSLPRERMVLS